MGKDNTFPGKEITVRKIGFALLFIVFIIAAANSKTKGAEDDLPDQLREKLETKIEKLLKRVDKIAKEEIREWEAEQENIKLLAEVIYHENWNTDSEHLAAYYTGAVVMNRVKSSAWPDTIKEVLYQRGQYSTTKKFFTKTLPDEVYDMARDIIRNGTDDVPENVIFQATFKQGHGVWKRVKTDYFCYG